MYGFEAISAANGWVISLVGICIVYTGLVVLYLFTSNLERLLNFWDRKISVFKRSEVIPPVEAPTHPVLEESQEPYPPEGEMIQLTPEQREVATYFEMIANRLGEPFSLPVLLEQVEKRGIHRPHFHLDIFLSMQVLEECGGEWIGFYRWRKECLSFNKLD
jgi:hypothetical protein